MTKKQLFDAIDGLFAYDTGCVSSGIKDEALRAKVREQLSTENLTEFLRIYYYEPGYDIEDVAAFIDWVRTRMGVVL